MTDTTRYDDPALATGGSYEELCEVARLAAGDIDKGKWKIGDVACEVTTRYGERNLADFARDINRSRTSVYDYRSVSAFYDAHSRARFRDADNVLTWSHYKRAMRAGTVAKAEDWLTAAADNTMTVEELERAMLIEKSGERLTKLATVDVLVRDIDIGLDRIRRAATEYKETAQMRVTISWVTLGREYDE